MTDSISFDRAAAYYDQTRAIPDEIMARVIPTIVTEVGTHGECLEIGVGTGRIAVPLAQNGIRVVGVDILREMLYRLAAKRSGSWPQIAVADATRLPFSDGSFDSALAVHVLHLIPRWRAPVEEVRRVLRPGGVLVVSRGGQRRTEWVRELSHHFFAEAGVTAWPPGVDGADELDGHMRGLGLEVGELPDISEETTISVDQVVTNMEAGYWSACWSVDPPTRHEAALKTRAWAEHEIGDLTMPRISREAEVWRAYRLAQ